ncbi:MAG: AAA family ATPase [Candidatus Njordarchaeia archaeon]
MPDFIHIKNFKSVENLKLDLKRINIFIGEPATGKSNILEAFGFLSYLYLNSIGLEMPFSNFVRSRDLADLFFVRDTTKKIELSFRAFRKRINIELYRTTKGYTLRINDKRIALGLQKKGKLQIKKSFDYDFVPAYYYTFSKYTPPRNLVQKAEVVLPPNGSNLLRVIREHGELRKIISEFLMEKGLELVLKMDTGELAIQGKTDGMTFELPLWLVSDSLQKLFVILVVSEIYSKSIIALEEPGAKTYPYYTKILAEQISFDKNNMYIITTHNPYILFPIIEKVSTRDINILTTRIHNCRTEIVKLDEESIKRILEGDVDPFVSIEEVLNET